MTSARCCLLYLVGQLRPGGAERQLWYLLRSLNRERYKSAVIVWNYGEKSVYGDHIRALGVPLYSLSKIGSRIGKLRALRRMVKQLQPEVIHSYTFYTNFAAHVAAHACGAIAVGSVRSDFTGDKRDSGALLGRLSARWPRVHICNSAWAAQVARQSRSPFVPKRVHVVRNGVDVEEFQTLTLLPNGEARLLAVGSLVPIKRWDRLVAAGLELKRMGYDFHVQIAGDGPLRMPLERHVRENGLGDRIEFMGHQADIAKLLSGSTFLVHASDSEGCPNVVVEAMACGRPVVATDAGDVPYIVEDGHTGFVVPRGDDKMLVDRMASLIGDRDLCLRMGEAARTKAEREFGLDRLVSETLAAYRDAGWRKV